MNYDEGKLGAKIGGLPMLPKRLAFYDPFLARGGRKNQGL